VDPAEQAALRGAAAVGRLPHAASLTDTRGDQAVLRSAANGACGAFEPAAEGRPALCAIHRALGHDALPSACRHFPRVCLLDARGASITLSHFCPTAASLLFEGGSFGVVDAPPGFSRTEEHEGLDARDALPPLLAPGMLMNHDEYAAWEASALAVLADERLSPERALQALARRVEACRTWTPPAGSLADRLVSSDADEVTDQDDANVESASSRCVTRFAEVLACVPEGLHHAGVPEAFGEIDRSLVQAEWPAFGQPLRRYLAARLHASWVPYQGRGLRTVVRSLAAALAVVRVETARQCAAAGRPLDGASLLEAFRMADLLLVHEADAQTLADRWSRCETEG
jgi:hypothetical protein